MKKIEFLLLFSNAVAGGLSAVFFNPHIYLLICCIITFLCYGIDKYDAVRNYYRFSEKFLIAMAIVGGAIPALTAMILFHHKTDKISFLLSVAGLAVLQFILIGVFI